MVECLLTGRNAIGVDINPEAVRLTREALDLGPTLEAPWGE